MRSTHICILSIVTGLLLTIPTAQLCSQPLPASAGTEFYIGLPFLGISENAQLRLSITAVAPANVTLEFLENGNTQSQAVDPGMPWELTIPRPTIEFDSQREGKTNRVIWIRSDQPVVIHATHDASWFTDSWVVPPVSQLGTDYQLMSAWSTTSFGGVAMIIATQDSTRVRITPTVPTSGGNPAGFSYGVTLHRGEAWHVVPLRPEFSDMTGTRFVSDKPVAIVGGHAGILLKDQGAANPLVESMVPTDQWGTEFHSIVLPRQDLGYYKILASNDATLVQVNGVPLTVLNAGESVIHEDPSPVDITTNEPVSVAQFTYRRRDSLIGVATGDPSMTLLQPYSAWSREYRWTTQSLAPRLDLQDPSGTLQVPFIHYMIVTGPTDFLDSIYYEGADISSFFRITHNNREWSSALLPIFPGEHHLASSVPVGVQLLGYSEFDAYFTPAGYNVPKALHLKPITAITCSSVLDTTIAIRNFSGESVTLDSVHFSGIDGETYFPQFPETIGPYAMSGLGLRIPTPNSGEIRGTIYLYSSADAAPCAIPILIRRQIVAGTFSVNRLNFGNVLEGEVVDTVIQFTNNGELPITIEREDILPPFQLTSPALPVTLQPGESQSLKLRFAPEQVGAFVDTLRLETSPCNLHPRLTLVGSLTDKPAIVVGTNEMPRLLCPDESPGTVQIVLYSTGGEPLVIDSATVEGDAAGEYILPSDLSGKAIPTGDSLVITLQFRPTGTGERRATLIVTHNAEPNRTEIALNGWKDSVLLEPSLAAVDFGEVLLCSDTIRQEILFRNRGTVDLKPDRLTLKNGEVLIEGKSNVIPPNDSLRVTIALVPTRTGELVDTLIFDASPCNLRERIPIRATLREPSLQLELDSLDFGLLTNCDDPKRLILRLTNDGEVVDTLSELRLSSTLFSIAPLTDSTIQPGESIELELTFAPDSFGSYSEELILEAEPCRIERNVLLRGEYRERAVDPNVADILLGTFLPSSSQQGQTSLHNSGEVPITIDAILFDNQNGRLQLISPPPGTIIQPGDSVQLVFRYTSENAEGFSSDVSLSFAGACPEAISFSISGEPGEIPLHLSLRETSGFVDQTVQVPIHLENPTGYRGKIRLRGELRWDYRNLFLRGISTPISGGSISVNSDTILGSDRILTLTYEGALTSTTSDLLAELKILVLLGVDDTTQMHLNVLELTPLDPENSLKMTKEDAPFYTLGICIVDGQRLIHIDQPLHTTKVRPNPANDYVDIEITSEREESGYLHLYNNVGHEVLNLLLKVSGGAETVRVPTDKLPPGIYRFSIERGNTRATGSFIVRW
ncbi:MAG: choice-of-anchor D domain-containing protein [Ignavibacteriae bacterium]|nr:choice-of-anchor D domain-containing protein [Ignavibacteriota bacterium]MCB9215617.1 choice-of-anchor D domain-containing protein [Ignavibacteria bacterium]